MPLEDVPRCPICDNNSFTPLLSSKDFTSTHETFHVKQCDACGLAITSPRPSEENSGQYYQSDKYISHTSSSKGIFDSIYLIIRRFSLRWKYRLIKPYLHQGPLLDYGAGTGHFLQEVKRNGHSVYGVEPSEDARKKIGTGIPVVSGLHDLPNQTFDVITLWHVLEHVYRLRETIQELKARLADRGTIFIAVPNRESYDAQHYQSLWAAYDVPRHLWHFTKDQMAALLQKEGLIIKQVIPMKLDAYYVSLLSERYKSGGKLTIPGIIRAVWIGLKSNLKGKNKTNQSSLIFVVQK